MNARRLPLALLLPWALACSATQTGAHSAAGHADAGSTPQDTVGRDLVPAGFGSLRQDDIAVKIRLPGLLVRAIPLDESIIRLLSPDSYRALRELRQGRRNAITQLARRQGVRGESLWYISFYGLEPEARFSPREVVISEGGRDFRPLDVVPLTPGFGEQRLTQREIQSAIFLFEDGMDVSQPLTVSVETTRDFSWDSTLRLIERERALVRSRAAQARQP